MLTEDEKFELFLKQFRPRRPHPLPVVSVGHRRLWMGAIAAGLVVIALTALVLRRVPPANGIADGQVEQGGRSSGPITPAAGIHDHVSHVVNWNVDALDRMLTEMSPRVLPDVERPDGSLHALARE